MDNDNKSLQNAEQFKHVSNAEYIEKGGYTLLVRKTISFILMMISVFIIWSIFATVNEVAISFGEVSPLEEVHVIQHVQGGTIEKVYVKNGDEVLQGQSLVKLDPDTVNAELQKAQSRELTLILNAIRLRAFLEKKPETSIDWQSAIKKHAYNLPLNSLVIQKSIKEDMNLLRQQNDERKNQQVIYKEKIAQKHAELKQFTDSKSELEKKLVLYQKEEEMYKSVVEKGYVSKRDYLEAQRKTIETTSQLKQVIAKIQSSQSEIQEAEKQLTNLDSVFNKQALEKLDEIDSELSTVRHTIQNFSDLNKKLIIRAPVTGIVKGLTASSGSVISPAQNVLEIVPTRGEMIIQCKISTKDIGHVKVGDPVQVKVLAYEFTRYGIVNGKIMEISASTFTTDKGLPYYLGKVSLEKNYVGDDAAQNVLKPGMTVQVDIITGKKSVMTYLLKPITRGLKQSFREP